MKAHGQDIFGVMTHIQAWELAYKQAQFQFNKVKDLQSSLEEISTRIIVFTPKAFKEMDFDLKYHKHASYNSLNGFTHEMKYASMLGKVIIFRAKGQFLCIRASIKTPRRLHKFK